MSARDWLAAEGISRTAPYVVPPYALYYDDEAEIRDAYWRIEPGDTVIDIGARYGSYTIPALAMGASVLAIDPHAEILGLLASTAMLNGFDDLTTMCVALLDRKPYPIELADEIGEIFPAGNTQWTTLDDIAPERVDWIKIDVEGVELAVLKGGMRALRERHPKLIIEDHTRVYPWCKKHRTRQRMHDLLRGLGYSIESIPYEPGNRGGSPRDFTIAI